MKKLVLMTALAASFIACNNSKQTQETPAESLSPSPENFQYTVDQFADIEILRYRVPDFESLSLKQRELVYYLNQAALEGRDIFYDQNNKYNLAIRRTLEGIYSNYSGDKSTGDWKNFETYLKQVWMANGIHHHYSEDKIIPKFSAQYFTTLANSVDPARLPVQDGAAVAEFLKKIVPVIFDGKVMPKRLNQAAGQDLVKTSSVNFYEGVSQKEVEDFYNGMKNPNDSTPVSFGLNSKVVMKNGAIAEEVYKLGGLYSAAIGRIVGWLEKAAAVAENEQQKKVIESLIAFYRTGDLKTFDDYSIEWVKDTDSQVDFINVFIETYTD
ncbi:MAG: dipeptidyl peptidase 3, partial [Dysgonamonadaceae bacterium]|nr:dipeptidyl peptidase 3 [Dysgonamonadaceae bacterium]